jgi:hypothetical protein
MLCSTAKAVNRAPLAFHGFGHGLAQPHAHGGKALMFQMAAWVNTLCS